MKIERVHVFIGTIITACVAAAVVGFYLIGPPTTQRAKQQDQMRVKHLQQIRSGIDAYWAVNSSLPETLEELRSNKTTHYIESLRDPFTNQSYEYSQGRLLMQYTLCAIFETKAQLRRGEELQEPYPNSFWDHPAGYHCFDLRANVTKVRTDSISETPQVREEWNEETMGKRITTYTHPNGYAVRYPASWKLQANAHYYDYPDRKIVNYVIIEKEPSAQVPDGYGQPCPANVVAVEIRGPFDYAKGQTLDQLATNQIEDGKRNKVFINGLLAYKFETSGGESVCAGPRYWIQLTGQKYLIADLILNARNEEATKTASQIAESIQLAK